MARRENEEESHRNRRQSTGETRSAHHGRSTVLVRRWTVERENRGTIKEKKKSNRQELNRCIDVPPRGAGIDSIELRRRTHKFALPTFSTFVPVEWNRKMANPATRLKSKLSVVDDASSLIPPNYSNYSLPMHNTCGVSPELCLFVGTRKDDWTKLHHQVMLKKNGGNSREFGGCIIFNADCQEGLHANEGGHWQLSQCNGCSCHL